MPEATANLAAFGVALAFAIIIESPVIMLMSASTALVEAAASFRALRRFALGLAALVTGAQVVVLLPPVFDLTARTLQLPADVANLTHGALAILLPWPGAIGHRRILGVSGRAILAAIIAGETDPERSADCTNGRLKAGRAEIVAAVDGRVTSHHRFLLELHLAYPARSATLGARWR